MDGIADRPRVEAVSLVVIQPEGGEVIDQDRRVIDQRPSALDQFQPDTEFEMDLRTRSLQPPVESRLTQQCCAIRAVDALQHMDRPGTAASQMMIADDAAPPLDHSDPLVQFARTAQLIRDEVASADAADLERSGED